MKIPSVGTELFHADTDMTKLIATFRNFAKAHKSDLSREVRASVVVLDAPSEVLRDPITDRNLEFQNLCCRD